MMRMRGRTVSKAARRRMVRAVREALDRHLWGGELWFTPEGDGGAWYSGASIPPDPRRTVIVRLSPGSDPAELVEEAVAAWEERYEGGRP